MLEARDLTIRHLGPMRLSVARGVCIALSGPSGAGKSLILRALADLEPNGGTVTLDGIERERFSAPEWRRQVGYLAADAGWWAATVGEHMADTDAARALLPRLHLPDDALAWAVSRLSTGERKRLALVRLLIQAPDFLLLDEPASGLDPEAAGAVDTLVQAHQAAGAGILLVTHDVHQRDHLADRLLTLRDGTLAATTASDTRSRVEAPA